MRLEETDDFVRRRHIFVLKDPARGLVNDLAHERQIMFECRHQRQGGQGRMFLQAQDDVPGVGDALCRHLDQSAIEPLCLVFKAFLTFVPRSRWAIWRARCFA